MSRLMCVLGMLAVAAGPAAAGPFTTGLGIDPAACTVDCALPGGATVNLMILPDGSGPALAAIGLAGGGTTDATVTAIVRDYSGDPVAGLPAANLWLEAGDDGPAPCGGQVGLIADGPTDEQGRAVWSLPPRGGGQAAAPLRVVVQGMVIGGPLPLTVNSPDLDGNGRVDLVDAAFFTDDLFGTYAFRSDFDGDGVINIVDVGRMAQALGAACD